MKMTRNHALRVLVLALAASSPVQARQFDLSQVIRGLNPLEILRQTLSDQIAALLGNQLPIRIDVGAAYPSLPTLPGPGFAPEPYIPTVSGMQEPLVPGDYTVIVYGFCMAHNAGAPGRGDSFVIGQIGGKMAGILSTLMWRGVASRKYDLHQLQVASWEIQAGLSYPNLSATTRTIIDEMVPGSRDAFRGDFIQNLGDGYQQFLNTVPEFLRSQVPPLNGLLRSLGPVGEAAYQAKTLREDVLRQNTSDQQRAQALFVRQDSNVQPSGQDGRSPWATLIPGVAYGRFRVTGGYSSENELDLRILDPSGGTTPSLADLMHIQVTPGSTPSDSFMAQSVQNANVGIPVGQPKQPLLGLPKVAPPDAAHPDDKSADLPGIGKIGLWMLTPDKKIADWIGQRWDGRVMHEPINVILLDKISKKPEEASARLLEAMDAAGYSTSSLHTGGYQAYIGEDLQKQYPKGQAISNDNVLLTNNHGRLFGPVKVAGGYVTIGALSREDFSLSRLTHTYNSFNAARDDLATQLDAKTVFKKNDPVTLDNMINSEESGYTTGDHDGRAVLLVAEP